MRRLVVVACVGLVVAVVLSTTASPASSARRGATGDLSLNVDIAMKYQFGDFCATPLPAGVQCVRFVGEGLVPGLGRVSTTYTKTVELANSDCPVTTPPEKVLTVASGDRIEMTMPSAVCGPTAPARTGPFEMTVTGGTGRFAQATGTLRLTSHVRLVDWSCGCGTGTDTWTGTLSVPGIEFDTVPPKITGPAAITTRAAARATRVRVRYAVTARDAVDGAVRVTCRPPSGSLFKVGRTKVVCSATDLSGNTSRRQFTVTVNKT